jgi:hypothetical protein
MAIDRSTDQFKLDAFAGTGGFKDGSYIVKFYREDADNYAERKSLSVYPNYVGKMVGVMSGFLWRQAPARTGDDAYLAFAANADGLNGSLNRLMQTHQRLAMLLGSVYLIVDRPAEPAQASAGPALPYIAMRMPSELAASAFDGMGRPTLYAFGEAGPDGKATVYRRFEPGGWRLTEDKEGTKPISSGEFPWSTGELPVARLNCSAPILPQDLRAPAWADSLIEMNWDMFNLLSELRWLLRSQTFAMLKMPASDPSERERLQDLTLGTNNMLVYDPANGGEPGFIAPPPDPVAAYEKRIEAALRGIYALANLEFVGAVQPSGAALAFHFQEANQTLGGFAAECEAAELAAARLAALWDGRDFQGSVAYPRDFDVIDLAAELKQAANAIGLGISPTFDAEVKKRAARQYLGHGAGADTLAGIDNEIEAGGDPYAARIAGGA